MSRLLFCLISACLNIFNLEFLVVSLAAPGVGHPEASVARTKGDVGVEKQSAGAGEEATLGGDCPDGSASSREATSSRPNYTAAPGSGSRHSGAETETQRDY